MNHRELMDKVAKNILTRQEKIKKLRSYGFADWEIAKYLGLEVFTVYKDNWKNKRGYEKKVEVKSHD